jgi:hypothetical protein
MSTWEQLFSVNVNENTNQKGKFTYLSWTFAWSELMKVCPTATYTIDEVEYHQDNSASVHTTITIDGLTHQMFLAVMDFKNKSVPNPDSMAINNARMRCLVKNIAMFGLGRYIYAGEDIPEAAPFDYSTIQPSVDAIIKGIAEGNVSTVRVVWDEMTTDERNASWRAKTRGGCFNTAEKKFLQSTEFRESSPANKAQDDFVKDLGDAT